MTAERPLAGIRVIGLEQYMSGPYCTMLLADAGAEVIKVERPGAGDPRRSIPPFVEKGGVRKAAGYLSYNRNKKSLALNLQSAAGQEVLRRLAKVSDVVVDNLRPGVTTRLGLDYDGLAPLNPRLVYAVISGFGRLPGYRSDYSDRPAFDIVAEAMSGVMNLIGFADRPPTYTLYGLADVYSGMVTAYGILQALFMRQRTGRGQLVDSSMVDNMLALNERMVTLYSVTGREPARGRLEHLWPRGAFECADGPSRAANAATLQPILEAWMADKSRREVVDTLNAAGVPTGPVYTADDVFADPHFRRRGMLLEVEDPELGATTFARTPPHLSAAPEIATAPAPNLGEHTRSILEQTLGYSPEEVDALLEQGALAAG